MRQDLELHERVPGKPLYWLVDPCTRCCPLSTQSCLAAQHDCNNTKRPLFISTRELNKILDIMKRITYFEHPVSLLVVWLKDD